MRYFIKKFSTLIITLFIISLLAFLAFQIIPGDPVTQMLGTEATESAKEALREQLGLNRPVLVRYFDWLLSFIRGDFGMSYNYRMPVGEMLADKLPITMMLTGLSFLFTVVFSIPIGILAGSAKSKKSDVAITSVNQMVMSIPAFFIGILPLIFSIVCQTSYS